MTPAARRDFRQQAAAVHTALRPGTVTLASGVSYAQGTVTTTGAELAFAEGGSLSGQVITWRIAKSVLPNAVPDKAVITFAGEQWIVSEIAGRESWKDTWTIKATK